MKNLLQAHRILEKDMTEEEAQYWSDYFIEKTIAQKGIVLYDHA